jgi:lipoate-protein ligase A
MEKLDEPVRGPLPPGHTAEQELSEDRHLFQRVENGDADYAWRLWEIDGASVVLGRFGNSAREVFENRCRRDGVPVVRRFSGGGAVVVGRGCLNVAIAFALPVYPELADVTRSYGSVLRGLADALSITGLSIAGGTDLAIGGRKVSGNAQRRGRRALLHHGTLLYDFDPTLAALYLREPQRQPEYRKRRRHTDFMGCLPVARDVLTARLTDALASLAPATEAC